VAFWSIEVTCSGSVKSKVGNGPRERKGVGFFSLIIRVKRNPIYTNCEENIIVKNETENESRKRRLPNNAHSKEPGLMILK
jgi:hypothetical protein